MTVANEVHDIHTSAFVALLFSLFPKFDLSTVIEKQTPLTRKLAENYATRQAHIKHYVAVFKQYLYWNSSTLLLKWLHTE